VGDDRVVWVAMCVLGLAAEAWVIIALGRRVTSRYEADGAPDDAVTDGRPPSPASP